MGVRVRIGVRLDYTAQGEQDKKIKSTSSFAVCQKEMSFSGEVVILRESR